ncbi:hypothetical protein M0R45_026341 [Rubus argutus]|uniref:BED-type domain-containing protein n=1 Tax=Rubus argutus TaxID=59490 RepID=A0AAW1X0U9_RUBAR
MASTSRHSDDEVNREAMLSSVAAAESQFVDQNDKSKGSGNKRKKSERKPRSLAEAAARERSWVWEHFSKEDHPIIEKVDGNDVCVRHTQRAQCKYCTTHLTCNSSSNGTSALKKYLEQVCKGYPGRTEIDKGQTHLATYGKDATVMHWTQENCITAVTEMIVMDELPFSFIERPGFRRFCSVAIPKFLVPSWKVIVKTFLRMYQSKKEELRKELSRHCVCLTTDTWTSVQNINYMVLTAHFIDSSWKMHKRVLNLRVISNNQGTTIGKILESCLHDWSIKKVLTISVDNASANKIAVDYIRKKMFNLDRQQVFGGKFLHVRCLAHIVNLIVRSGLHLMDKSVTSIRHAVRFVRSSSSRLDAFKLCVQKESLDSKKICVLDVPTRWNSTYIMLDTALELKQAFDRMAEEEDVKYRSYFDEDEEYDEEEGETDLNQVMPSMFRARTTRRRVGPPSEADWEKATVFVRFLKVFFDVIVIACQTVRVSATNHSIASKAFHDIVAIKAEIEDFFIEPHNLEASDGGIESIEVEKVLIDMAVKMKAKYKKYFASLDDMNQLLLVALVLDPRYKLRNFSRVCKTMLGYDDFLVKKKFDEVKQLVVSLTNLYASSFGTQTNQKKSSASDVASSSSDNYGSKKITRKMASMEEDWDKELEEGEAVVVAHEVDRYLLDPIEKPPNGTEFNILVWWRINGSKYPNMQAAARDVLAIQVSTVASESCFSTGKRVTARG